MVGGYRDVHITLPSGMTKQPLYRRVNGQQGPSEWVWKISPPPGLVPRIFQPVASCGNGPNFSFCGS